MFLKIFRVIFLFNYLYLSATPSVKNVNRKNFNGDMEKQVLQAPFFELPCMHIGGICARGFACPPGTKVRQRGLCPQQQRLGMECCKPCEFYGKHNETHHACIAVTGRQRCIVLPPEKKCSAKKGYCMTKKHTCPNRITNDMTDCLPTEVCCIHDGH